MAETSVGYKCPNCSAPLTFLPGHDKVTCEYCGTELEVKTIEEMYAAKEAAAAKAQAAKEAKWDTSAAGSEWEADEAEQMKAFTCSSCGAQIVSDGNTMATECCYCGSPTMLPSRFEGMLKPDFIIPFKKTKEQAVAALKEFYKGRTLLPNSFTANNRVEDIQAMYCRSGCLTPRLVPAAAIKVPATVFMKPMMRLLRLPLSITANVKAPCPLSASL